MRRTVATSRSNSIGLVSNSLHPAASLPLIRNGQFRALAKLNSRPLIALPDVKERLPTLGFEPIGNTPEEFEAQIKTDLDKWARIVRDANVTTQ